METIKVILSPDKKHGTFKQKANTVHYRIKDIIIGSGNCQFVVSLNEGEISDRHIGKKLNAICLPNKELRIVPDNYYTASEINK